jgi:lysyl-tRNA synthetase class I
MFCKHDWKILSEVTTKSAIEHAQNIGAVVQKANGYALERKYIQIIVCKKCGKARRFVEEI